MTTKTTDQPLPEAMHGPRVTPEMARDHGLSQAEYERVAAALGREPTYTELGVVSVMWSEHCSYKSSRVHLKKLPTQGERVIQGPGENAGVVDIGDGQAVVFKMESHNHPSFIEPFQGAATGVGGICRDVFTMGARPIALADSLRFGRPGSERTRYLIGGVVAGIAAYGNSFGVPTVAGDVAFDESYDGNILVNAFCLGLAAADRIFLGRASGVGNPVIYVGAKTGRDGIHGATMASAEFGEDAQEKRPAVQVGDPFMEKLLLEACLELMAGDILVGIQDMGAAGLTSSSVEMAARAGSGIELELERVPQRERGMTPYEILLSESQERMLMVVERGREAEALAVFAKWDLDAAVIGRVTDSGRVVVRMHGQVFADLPAALLAEGVVYERPMARPSYLDRTAAFTMPEEPDDAGACLVALLGSPGIASKSWVYEQYDHNVRHGTVVRPGAADAGIVRVFGPQRGQKTSLSSTGHHFADAQQKGIAITSGCASRQVYLAPRHGTELVVAEAYANLVAVGATPLAVTNCLNFGNPERPEIMWQFAESVEGLASACQALGTPVVSGNVSLYNETDGKAIKPTPMVAMVGLLQDAEKHVTMDFKAPGHVIAVVGQVGGSLAGSEYLERICGQVAGVPQRFEPALHKPVFDAVLAMIQGGYLASAHDISEGGLAVAVAECVMSAAEPLSAQMDVSGYGKRIDEVLFGEGPARFVISLARSDLDVVRALAKAYDASLAVLGETTKPGKEAVIAFFMGDEPCIVPVEAARRAHGRGFRDIVE